MVGLGRSDQLGQSLLPQLVVAIELSEKSLGQRRRQTSVRGSIDAAQPIRHLVRVPLPEGLSPGFDRRSQQPDRPLAGWHMTSVPSLEWGLAHAETVQSSSSEIGARRGGGSNGGTSGFIRFRSLVISDRPRSSWASKPWA